MKVVESYKDISEGVCIWVAVGSQLEQNFEDRAVVLEGVSIGAAGPFPLGVQFAVPAPLWMMGALGEVGEANHRLFDVELHRCGPANAGSFGSAPLPGC